MDSLTDWFQLDGKEGVPNVVGDPTAVVSVVFLAESL